MNNIIASEQIAQKILNIIGIKNKDTVSGLSIVLNAGVPSVDLRIWKWSLQDA